MIEPTRVEVEAYLRVDCNGCDECAGGRICTDADGGARLEIATALLAAWDALEAEKRVSEWLADRLGERIENSLAGTEPAKAWLTAAREATKGASDE